MYYKDITEDYLLNVIYIHEKPSHLFKLTTLLSLILILFCDQFLVFWQVFSFFKLPLSG